jgi:putative phosphotransacetylase
MEELKFMDKFMVEVSARHVHLSQADLETLFGKGAELHPMKSLSQPGMFASEEKVTIKCAKGELTARVLGPVRPQSQVELSLTEARQVGVKALIRESGVLDGTNGCTLVGPAGEIELPAGVIAAKRHVHMTPADAEKYGVKSGDIVAVKVETPDRSIIFGDTVIRVRSDMALAMHIDTDEANAAGISGTAEGEIVKF